ncbi:MAG: alpha/beta fold hydrolase [Planctomycetaceae bacterium]
MHHPLTDATTTYGMTMTDAAFRSEYPFVSQHLELDGLRYHYVDEGSGDPLLFVHGNPTWSFAWRNLVKDLARDHRCLAVDHIGCGLSDKPQNYPYRLATHIDNLVTLVDRLDLREATLVAHDWGGAIGAGTVLKRPDRFSRLVLMNTAAFRSQRIPFRISVCRIPLLGAIAVRGFNAFAGAATFMAVTKPLSRTIKDGYLRPYRSWADRVAVLRFVQDIPLSPSHPSYATLVEIDQGLSSLADKPMLLVWGMRDWCFTPAFLEEFERRFPQAETVRLDDAGHYVFEDADERLRTALRAFLAKRASENVEGPPEAAGGPDLDAAPDDRQP